jgi:hypothetical protein
MDKQHPLSKLVNLRCLKVGIFFQKKNKTFSLIIFLMPTTIIRKIFIIKLFHLFFVYTFYTQNTKCQVLKARFKDYCLFLIKFRKALLNLSRASY